MAPRKRKKVLTITEFARMGGYALARKRSQEQRIAAAKHAVGVRWAKETARRSDEDPDNPSAILKDPR
jgi:hypothetical protein